VSLDVNLAMERTDDDLDVAPRGAKLCPLA
jgi:hypothetical protein